MGHSQAEKAASHERILNIAARAIREYGPENLAIADVMQAAGLTHGAFYSHFDSRAHLLAAAVERALEDGERRFGIATDMAAAEKAARYLSAAHRDARGKGCVVASLAMDAVREDARRPVAERLRGYIESMAADLGEGEAATNQARAIWALMAGGLTLSRLFDGAESDAMLNAAREAVATLVANGKGARP